MDPGLRALVNRPTAPITTTANLTLESPLSEFFPFFAKEMVPEKQQAAAAIAHALTNDFGINCAGAMFQLYVDEFQRIVAEHGGMIGWTRSIEWSFSQEFRRMPTNTVPESATAAARAPHGDGDRHRACRAARARDDGRRVQGLQRRGRG